MKDLIFHESGHPVRKDDFITLKERSDKAFYTFLNSFNINADQAILLDADFLPLRTQHANQRSDTLIGNPGIVYYNKQFYSIEAAALLNQGNYFGVSDPEFEDLGCIIIPKTSYSDENSFDINASPVEYEDTIFKKCHIIRTARYSYILGTSETAKPYDWNTNELGDIVDMDETFIRKRDILSLKDLTRKIYLGELAYNLTNTATYSSTPGSLVQRPVAGNSNPVAFSSIQLNKYLELQHLTDVTNNTFTGFIVNYNTIKLTPVLSTEGYGIKPILSIGDTLSYDSDTYTFKILDIPTVVDANTDEIYITVEKGKNGSTLYNPLFTMSYDGSNFLGVVYSFNQLLAINSIPSLELGNNITYNGKSVYYSTYSDIEIEGILHRLITVTGLGGISPDTGYVLSPQTTISIKSPESDQSMVMSASIVDVSYSENPKIYSTRNKNSTFSQMQLRTRYTLNDIQCDHSLFSSSRSTSGGIISPYIDIACPYLYLNYNNKQIFYSEILENQEGILNDKISETSIDSFYIKDNKLNIYIKEEKNEISYIDYIYIKIGDITIKPINYEFKDKYTSLRQGEQIELEFNIPSDIKENIVLISKGYYITI